MHYVGRKELESEFTRLSISRIDPRIHFACRQIKVVHAVVESVSFCGARITLWDSREQLPRSSSLWGSSRVSQDRTGAYLSHGFSVNGLTNVSSMACECQWKQVCTYLGVFLFYEWYRTLPWLECQTLLKHSNKEKMTPTSMFTLHKCSKWMQYTLHAHSRNIYS